MPGIFGMYLRSLIFLAHILEYHRFISTEYEFPNPPSQTIIPKNIDTQNTAWEMTEHNRDRTVWELSGLWSKGRFEYDAETGILQYQCFLHPLLLSILPSLSLGVIYATITGKSLLANWLFVGTWVFYLVIFAESTMAPSYEAAIVNKYRLSWFYYSVLTLALLLSILPVTYTLGTYEFLSVVSILLLYHYSAGKLPTIIDSTVASAQTPTHVQIAMAGILIPIFSFLGLCIFIAFWQIVPSFAWVLSVGTAMAVSLGCVFVLVEPVRDVVETKEPVAFDSSVIRAFFLGIYIIANILSVGFTMSFFNMSTLAAIGIEIFPTTTLAPWLVRDVSTTLEWVTLSAGNTQINLLAGLVFLAVPLPLTVFVIGWVYEVIGTVAMKPTLITQASYQSESIDTLSSDVEMLVVETDKIVLQPISVLFGYDKYIAISQPVLKTLRAGPGNELEAAMLHEFYHLKNRDLILNGLAGLFSIFTIGGRNAALAFYDYPQTELDADDYAANVVDPESLIEALDRVKELNSKREIQSYSQTTPGLVVPSPDDNPPQYPGLLVPIQSIPYASRVLHTAIRLIRMQHQLFFGGIIFETAHKNHDDRIDRLQKHSEKSES